MKFVQFILSNFGPVLAFLGVNALFGLLPALMVSLAWAVLEIAWKLQKRQKLSRFFLFSSLLTIVFGAFDLYSQQFMLTRYESCVTNILTAIFFGASIFGEKSTIQEFRENDGSPQKPMTPERVRYFKILTGVWTAYFLAKAGAYFWIAGHFSWKEGLLIRSALGTGSLYALIFLSISGSKILFPALKRWGCLGAEPIAANSD